MISKTAKYNKNGMALVTAVVVVAVLFILGIGILGRSSNEAKLTGRQYSRTQAYYAARSGVEVALMKIEELMDEADYIKTKDLYDAIPDKFLDGSVANGEDYYEVEYVDETNKDQIKILGTGTRNGVRATTALTLDFGGNISGSNVSGWFTNGDIIKAELHELAVGAAIIVPNDVGHPLKKVSNNATAVWKAISIHFTDEALKSGYSMELAGKSMEFHTDLLSFRKGINMTKWSADALELYTYTENGFRDSDGSALWLNNSEKIKDGWGVMVLRMDITSDKEKNPISLRAGYYAFAPGTQLLNSTHVQLDAYRNVINNSHFAKIENINTQAYIDNIIRIQTGLQMGSADKIWSRE